MNDLQWFICGIVFCFLLGVIHAMWKYYWRMKTIQEKGWPPQYLDADGDSVELSKRELENDNAHDQRFWRKP